MKNELISMVDFVKFINSLTTTELIKEFPNHFTEYRPSLHKDMVRYLLSIDAIKWKITKEFMQFLNTPLNISMFVPAIKVGDKWEVLEMPNKFDDWIMKSYHPSSKSHIEELEQYQTAKDNVIFEGWTLANETQSVWSVYDSDNRLVFMKEDGECLDSKTIQDLVKYKPTLTKKGLDDSGLNR